MEEDKSHWKLVKPEVGEALETNLLRLVWLIWKLFLPELVVAETTDPDEADDEEFGERNYDPTICRGIEAGPLLLMDDWDVVVLVDVWGTEGVVIDPIFPLDWEVVNDPEDDVGELPVGVDIAVKEGLLK